MFAKKLLQCDNWRKGLAATANRRYSQTRPDGKSAMNLPPELFGFYGFTHGWARILTVMSPQGASAALHAVPDNDDVAVQSGYGQLTRYQEKREGALERLVAEHGIIVLSRSEWDARKAELGETIYL
jgi:hypothetical protein